MKYYEVEFVITPSSCDACDLLAALAGEAGFETFEETETGLNGYVQQTLFDEAALKEAIDDFPFEGVTISYEVREAEDRDWNEQWEQEGFDPIIVESGKSLAIHDGRHLPEGNYDISIEIDAKMAFGTGTHETTRMVCETLLDIVDDTPRVLDCGTGTGILSICALKLGAQEAIGYDIDEWSADNARHNAVINRVDDRFTSLLGDASILNKVEGTFDLVLANINRNILLRDMHCYVDAMRPQAHIFFSGFYTEDLESIKAEAERLGLHYCRHLSRNNWVAAEFKK